MRTEKRTRNIRLRDQKIIYSQELKDRTFKACEEDVSNGVVRQRELEEKVLMYYRRTTCLLYTSSVANQIKRVKQQFIAKNRRIV